MQKVFSSCQTASLERFISLVYPFHLSFRQKTVLVWAQLHHLGNRNWRQGNGAFASEKKSSWYVIPLLHLLGKLAAKASIDFHQYLRMISDQIDYLNKLVGKDHAGLSRFFNIQGNCLHKSNVNLSEIQINWVYRPWTAVPACQLYIAGSSKKWFKKTMLTKRWDCSQVVSYNGTHG